MSELKATTSGEIRAKDFLLGYWWYEKSEADKEIDFWKKESHDHYERWFNLNKQYEGWLGKVMRCERAERELRNQKYKRCLLMAEWCEATALWCYQAANTLPAGFRATLHNKPTMIEPERLFKRYERLTKWSGIWTKLAEHFKIEESAK